MNTGDRIKECRIKLGLTQEDLGELVGVSKSTISKYESGKIENLKVETINKLIELFKVTPEWIMCWEENRPNRIAEEFKGENFTEEEISELKKYAEYLKSQRK